MYRLEVRGLHGAWFVFYLANSLKLAREVLAIAVECEPSRDRRMLNPCGEVVELVPAAREMP